MVWNDAPSHLILEATWYLHGRQGPAIEAPKDVEISWEWTFGEPACAEKETKAQRSVAEFWRGLWGP